MKCKMILLFSAAMIGLSVGKPTETTACPARCNLSHGFCNPSGQCKCFTGWKGPECNQCTPAIGCVHGTCKQPGQCICEAGWAGPKCNKDQQYCERHRPCRNGATCINNLGGFKCVCPPGLAGTTCQDTTTTQTITPNNLGKPHCLNGGRCVRGNEETGCERCSCPAGFTGARCEQIVRMCVMRPCANGGHCQDVIGNFRCECAHGYRGKYCTEDINECSVLGRHACENGGTCVNRFGSYTCACADGYKGSRCQTRVVVPPTTTTPPPTTTTTSTPATTTTTKPTTTTTETTTEKAEEIIVVPRLVAGVSKSNIKVTHIVRQVEVESSNGDVSFIREVVDQQGALSATDQVKSSVTMVQALTFAFLGVAIALFIGIGIFMWIHCSRRGKKISRHCSGESPNEGTPMSENSREASIVKTRHGKCSPPQYVREEPKPGFPMRAVALPSEDRGQVECLYVALPDNSSSDISPLGGHLLNSSLPAYEERY
uniref:EGF-like domain-containing protein n=1 Tax=Ciona savignyi TaxID=51511 RepID=H2YMF1_CIOSA